MILTLPQRHPEQPQAEWLISIDTLVAPLQVSRARETALPPPLSSHSRGTFPRSDARASRRPQRVIFIQESGKEQVQFYK